MSALPSSSSSTRERKRDQFKYDIFLSFHGSDTRKGFTSHLYKALKQQGIEAFKDDRNLERGEYFAPELLRAIKESWGSIIVISERFAYSNWCLKELVEIMKQEERGHRVYPIFYHVSPSDFRHQRKSVKEVFDIHEQRYDKDTTEGWRVALTNVTHINGWFLHDQIESDFIDDIVKDVSNKINVEYEKEVETMKSTLRKIQAWVVDAEIKQYMKEGEALKVWLDELKHLAYDMDDALDEWDTAILKSKIEKDQAQTPSISSSSLSKVQLSVEGRGASSLELLNINLPAPPESDIPSTSNCFGGIALRIKELNEKSQDIIKQKDNFPFPLGLTNSCTDLKLERQTVSLVDKSVVYGRDLDKDALIRLLLSNDNSGGSDNGIPLLAIVGMGGIGKTTLAQLAYNDDKVKKHFNQRIWVCVSDPFDVVGIAKAILESLNGDPSSFKELESLLKEIYKKITGEKFLLVLDDVWTEDEEKWEQLKLSLCSGSRESKIMVTTRKENVASILGCPKPFLLTVLSNEDSWSLFSKIAFFGRSYQNRESLESMGRMFVEKCAGLPLAVKTLASLLRFKRSREQWQRILDSHLWELDEAKKGLFSPLLLSYYDLPLPLRQCFSYCAIFPKDHMIQKDMLIKLWMAQGFIEETHGNNMEIVGEEYFDNLATRSFFQEFETDADDDSIIIRCKMHDIVHDFAQFLRKTEYCTVASDFIKEQGGDSYQNVHHLTLISGNVDVGILDSTFKVKKLRSLLIDSRYYDTSILGASLRKLFDQLMCLRMLNLSKGEEVLLEIGKLIHLRYLSFEENDYLWELPETLCDLCNLQTLNIRGCWNLRELPLRMEKLIKLRHLLNRDTNHLTFMPKGMQRLTCLQTLELLNLVKKGGFGSETSFSLADLGNLIHLRGHLEINGLGNVNEVSEAREAQLSTKAGLHSLTLNFCKCVNADEEDDEDVGEEEDDEDVGEEEDEEQQTRIEDGASVLEALHPPQHLQILVIWNCNGQASPSWMTSLPSLKSVYLYHCENWESLPPIGKLPSLESLKIRGMKKVKKVGDEFVGVETSSSSSFVNHNNIAFPNLKTLSFEWMLGWEEWEYDEKVLRSTTIMPKLQRLSISSCWELKTLPRHILQSRTLQELKILDCLNLYRCSNKETGDDCLLFSISHIPTLNTSTPQYLQISSPASPSWMKSLTSLKSVVLHYCENWESLPPMGKLLSLESLQIGGMKKVKKVGQEFVGVETSSSSSSSFVNHNNNIAFPNLKTLEIYLMSGWEEWEYDEEVLGSTTIMPKLQCLSISSSTKLKTLPRHLLQSRTLQELEIFECDNLYRRFNKETGDDWPSISHIPTLKIGHQLL